MVQWLPGFRAIAVGCGTVSLPEASASGGSLELRSFRPIALGTLATQWFHGSKATATLNGIA